MWFLASAIASVNCTDELDFVVRTLTENHPAGADPRFVSSLGEAPAAEPLDAVACKVQLARWVRGFQDDHLVYEPRLHVANRRWIPLEVRAQGDAGLVVRSSHAGVAAGAQIDACDGEPLAAWVTRVLHHAPRHEADVSWAVPRIFAAGFADRLPGQCAIDGVEIALESIVQPETTVQAALRQAQLGRSGPPGYRLRTVDGIAWLELGTFRLDAKQQSRHRRIVASLTQLATRDVVVDLRGNGGGNSARGIEILAGLWGDAYRRYWTPPAPWDGVEKTLWRASEGNIAHFQDYLAALPPGEHASSVGRVVDGMRSSHARGERFWVSTRTVPPRSAPPSPPRRTGRVVVLTDERCASACLTFLDDLLGMPGVVHLGWPTSADTAYLDVRVVDTPLGSSLMFPQKAYVGRMRGPGVPHVPTVRLGDDRSDAAVRAAVRRALE